MATIRNEIPATVDQVAGTYQLANTPGDEGISLYQDEARMMPGVHYTLTGRVIQFLGAFIPPADAQLLADYNPVSSVDPGTGDLTTLANVKGFLNITNVASDALLSRLITAQSTWFKNQVQRQIVRKTYDEKFNGQDERVAAKGYMSPWIAGALYGGFFVGARGYAITLYEYPVLAINYVYIDGGDGNGNIGVSVPQATNLGQTTQTDGWVLHDNGQLELLGFRFTVGVNNCEINYDAGFDVVPADIEQAVIDLVCWKFEGRKHIGQASRGTAGEQVTFSQSDTPSSVQAVIDNYRKVRV